MHATGQRSASALTQARPGMLCILLVARSCVWAVAISSNWLRCVCALCVCVVCALCVCVVCACVYMCVSTCVCIECSYVLCVWGEVRTYFIHHWKQQLCFWEACLYRPIGWHDTMDGLYNFCWGAQERWIEDHKSETMPPIIARLRNITCPPCKQQILDIQSIGTNDDTDASISPSLRKTVALKPT